MPETIRLSLDHAQAAEDLLDSAESAALPPAMRVEAAKAHALLALTDQIEQLRDELAGRGSLSDRASR